MGKLTFILGGARSGKSAHAQRLAQAHGDQVLFIATATADDDDMRSRIARHRAERPAHWQTLEAPSEIAQALSSQQSPSPADLIVVDCLTLLVSNALLRGQTDFDHPDEEIASEQATAEVDNLLAALSASTADWIVVSNEVGLGLVPPYPLGRIYRDLLGRANQRLAARADEVYWMVAGIPVPIHAHRVGAAQLG